MTVRIGEVVQLERDVNSQGAKIDKVMLDMGGGINNHIEGKFYTTLGDDSNPLPLDYGVLTPTNKDGGGSGLVTGFLDIISDKKAEPGEKRIYARDSTGQPVAEIYLKKDGSLLISNGSGNVDLLANGNINLNGVVIDTSGNISNATSITSVGTIDGTTITGSTDVIAGTISGKSHVHSGVTTGGGSTLEPTV